MHPYIKRLVHQKTSIIPNISIFIILFFNISYAAELKVLHSNQSPFENDFISNVAQESDSDTEDGRFRIGVNVDLITIYTSVFDNKDRFISGLQKEDFNLYEDGALQEISYFSQVDAPITIGIVIDLSASMQGNMEQVNRAAQAFITASNPDDQIFLVGFNDNVEVLQEFTSDVDEITDALENAITTGGTALYDAVYLSVEEAHRGEKDKKAIVVITDGEDKDSFYNLKELVSFVQESDVQIYNIGYLDEIPEKSLFGRWFKSDAEKARDALIRFSEESGGKAYFPEKIDDLHEIVAEIASELRNQYSIGYFSTNEDRDGSWRRVVVTLNKKVVSEPVIRHRRGYYAPKDK